MCECSTKRNGKQHDKFGSLNSEVEYMGVQQCMHEYSYKPACSRLDQEFIIIPCACMREAGKQSVCLSVSRLSSPKN